MATPKGTAITCSTDVIRVAAPGGPAGPVGPAGPCAPVAPVGPTGPRGPVAPIAPVEPVAPCGPAAPVAPGGPIGPGTAKLTAIAAPPRTIAAMLNARETLAPAFPPRDGCMGPRCLRGRE